MDVTAQALTTPDNVILVVKVQIIHCFTSGEERILPKSVYILCILARFLSGLRTIDMRILVIGL